MCAFLFICVVLQMDTFMCLGSFVVDEEWLHSYIPYRKTWNLSSASMNTVKLCDYSVKETHRELVNHFLSQAQETNYIPNLFVEYLLLKHSTPKSLGSPWRAAGISWH